MGFVLFSFRKAGRAVFLSHLNVMTIFERAMQRAGLKVRYSEGFNPKPKLEFASPLSLGYYSEEEIGRIEITEVVDAEVFSNRINRALHQGFAVTHARVGERVGNRKLKSLMSRYWGSEYLLDPSRENPMDISVSERILRDHLYENDLTNCSVMIVGGKNLHLRIRQNGKISSLKAFLNTLHSDDPWFEKWKITRLRTFAESDTGDPVSFFD